MKIMSIAGARPNFMKLASISRSVITHNLNISGYEQFPIQHVIVHTGQHYDEKMSKSFFSDLRIPEPNINLGVGSGTHASQTAEIMKKFETVVLDESPDILIVVGDVNSTIACALVASKVIYNKSKRIRPIIVHIEAGLRSFDRNMPEEINRILTDSISDILFITEKSAHENLLNEGIDDNKIHFCGNVMIDTLNEHLSQSSHSKIKTSLAIEGRYSLVTLHRPVNVDTKEALSPIIETLIHLTKQSQLVFPVHPRTKNSLIVNGLWDKLVKSKGIILSEPLGYLDFLNLVKDAQVVITDSGGIQEETTVLGIPCLTLRNSTERPVTVTEGTNYLIGTEPDRIIEAFELIIAGQVKKGKIPKYWDGKAGDRILKTLVSIC